MSNNVIEECRKIVEAAKLEIDVPEFAFGFVKMFSWDLYPSSTLISGYGKLETKSRAKKICKSAYDNREIAVKEKAAVYADYFAGIVGNKGYALKVKKTVEKAVQKCNELLNSLNIEPPRFNGFDIAAPVVDLDKSALLRELCDDVVDYENPFSFGNYFPLFCDIDEFEHETINRLGMWVNKTDYSCDCLECIDKMANDLNSGLRFNCKRIWARFFPTSVKGDTPAEEFMVFAERFIQSDDENEDVPGKFSEYCEAVRAALDLWLRDIASAVSILTEKVKSIE